MYLARFALDAGEYSVAVADLGCLAGTPLVPQPWLAILDGQCDVALRLCYHGDQVQGRLLISAQGPSLVLEHVLERLQASTHPADGVKFGSNSDEFASLATRIPPHHVWLNQYGYVVRGHPVAADFQLFPLMDHLLILLGDSRDLTYQINLRRHRPDSEEERTVRKYVAGLRLDPPFPIPMANLQTSIANRLLQSSFLSDEILATSDEDTLKLVLEEIHRHFDATMGPFGFDTPPLETGQFEDLLISGLHSSCFGEQTNFLCHGAGAFPPQELRRFLSSSGPMPPLENANAPPTAGRAPVFLSYASKDYVQAVATSRHLESHGIACWIAPRNILPGEAYPDAIIRAINACDALVVLLSESSNLSPHVQREIERALHRNAVIIPLRLQDIQPTGSMEYLLSTCQWIDAFRADFDKSLAHLRERLKAILATDPG